MLKPCALSLVMCLTVGCAPMLTRAEYLWGSYATRRQDLYVIRRVAEFREDRLPFPEEAPPKLISEQYEVLVADLRGKTIKPAEQKMIPPVASLPADYEHVAFDEMGRVELWGKEALSQQLRSAGNITCRGSVQYDEQDSRVLYYRCDDEPMAYRFESLTGPACPIRLGPAGKIQRPLSDEYRFWSVAGQRVAFISVGWGFLYEIDLCGDQPAREIDRFTSPDRRDWAEPSKSQPEWLKVKSLPYRLIGMGEGVRLYQIHEGSAEAVVMVNADGTTRRFPLPGELNNTFDGRYLAQDGYVIWNVMDERLHRHTVHSLDLSSGRFGKTELPDARRGLGGKRDIQH